MNLSRLFLYLTFLSIAAPAWSAEFCISSGDVDSLSVALATAANNGEDNFVYLEPGSYQLSAANPNLAYYVSTSNNLTIEGGYTPFFGGGCGKLIQYSADATVVDGTDGDHSGHAVFLSNTGGGLITLKFVKVQNTLNTNPSPKSPVILGDLNNGNVNIDLENVIFEGNVSIGYYPIDIGSNQTIIRNSVFAKNQVFAGYPQIHIDAKSSGFCAAILDSTVTSNTGGYYALRVDGGADCIPVIANSIFWGNSSGDLFISIANQSSVSLFNNDIENFGSSPGTIVNGQETSVTVDPLFVDHEGNYALSDASLLHDHGSSLDFLGGPGPLDVSALPRTDGAYPDIGAYEIQDVIFANGVDQSLP